MSEATVLAVKVLFKDYVVWITTSPHTSTQQLAAHAHLTKIHQMHSFPYFASSVQLLFHHTICLSYFVVISSPSTGSPSCAAVNCFNPSQPLYVFTLLVCLSLCCDPNCNLLTLNVSALVIL